MLGLQVALVQLSQARRREEEQMKSQGRVRCWAGDGTGDFPDSREAGAVQGRKGRLEGSGQQDTHEPAVHAASRPCRQPCHLVKMAFICPSL